MPSPEIVDRIEWSIPDGVSLKSILSGAWQPYP